MVASSSASTITMATRTPLEVLAQIMQETEDPISCMQVHSSWRDAYVGITRHCELDSDTFLDKALKRQLGLIISMGLGSVLQSLTLTGNVLSYARAGPARLARLASSLPRMSVLIHSSDQDVDPKVFLLIEHLRAINAGVELRLCVKRSKQSRTTMSEIAKHVTRLEYSWNTDNFPAYLGNLSERLLLLNIILFSHSYTGFVQLKVLVLSRAPKRSVSGGTIVLGELCDPWTFEFLAGGNTFPQLRLLHFIFDCPSIRMYGPSSITNTFPDSVFEHSYQDLWPQLARQGLTHLHIEIRSRYNGDYAKDRTKIPHERMRMLCPVESVELSGFVSERTSEEWMKRATELMRQDM
jgi:hypothetical protein